MNNSHMVDCVDPFPEINISCSISLPRETDPYSPFAMESGASYFDRVGSSHIYDGTHISLDEINIFPAI